MSEGAGAGKGWIIFQTLVTTAAAAFSMGITSYLSVSSIEVAAQGIESAQKSAARDSCLNYVNFVLEQQAGGQADYQIDRTTDLLAVNIGDSMSQICGTSHEIRQAWESNTPLARLQENSP